MSEPGCVPHSRPLGPSKKAVINLVTVCKSKARELRER